MKYFEDGDNVCITVDSFVDLQESPAVFYPKGSKIGQAVLEGGLDALTFKELLEVITKLDKRVLETYEGEEYFDNYQSLAGRTAGAGTENHEKRLVTATLGLAGEAGEFANLVKKMTAHGHPLDVEALTDELGDVMWYLAEAATTLDVCLSDVGKQNIKKLRRRYPDGFSSKASISRTR